MDKITSALLSLPPFNGRHMEMSKTALYAVRAVCLIMVAACVFGATYCILPKQKMVTDIIYQSSVGVDAEYAVNLSENSFFETDVLGMDENYIRSLLDSVDIDFDIDCTHSGSGQTTVRYDVKGTISAWYRDGNDNLCVWSHDETLVEVSYTDMSSSDCSYNVPVNIVPSKYSGTIKKFQDDMALNVNAYYDVAINGTATYVSEGRGNSKSFTSYVSIPLTGQVFTIERYAPEESFTSTFTRDRIITLAPNSLVFWLLVVFAVIMIFAAVISFLCLAEYRPDKYKAALAKMISQIEDRIAYVQGEQTCKLSDIRLADFESIIRLADERILPIFCVRDDVERTAVFFVTENNQKFFYGFSEQMLEEYEDEEEYEEEYEEYDEGAEEEDTAE